MYAAFSNTNPKGPGYGFSQPAYPPPQSAPGGYGYPPGPGYNYPPPPPYNVHNTYYNSSRPPPPNNHSYPGENASYYNSLPAPAPANNMNMPQPLPQFPAGPKVFLLRQSPSKSKTILIHPSGTPATAPPLYSLTSTPQNSKAEYVLARGPDPNNASALVAEVHSHKFSSKYDLIVRGQACLLKESSSGSSYNIEIPGRGKYKWVLDQEGLGSKMWLKDEGKTRVFATYDKSRGPSSTGGWKKLIGGGGKDRELVVESGVQGDEFLVEVLIVSLYAVKMAKEETAEVAGEIVSALVGC